MTRGGCPASLVIAAWLVAVGCSDRGPVGSDTAGPPADSTRAAAVFADTGLERVIRTALDRPTDALYAGDLLGLATLQARRQGIIDLKGLAQAANLCTLDLADNRVRDLSPLAGLMKLRFLDLSNNQVTDLSPLAGLSDLEYLVLSFNQITDLSPLLGLMHLQSVDLSYNPLNEAALAQQLPRLHTGETQVVYVPIPGAEAPADTLEAISPWAIAFLSNRDDTNEIYAMQADGSRPIRLTNTPWNEERFSWSPDGSQFVFAGDDAVYLQDLYTLNASILFRATGRLASGRTYWPDPWWLPDGVRVVVTPAYPETAFPVYVIDTRDGQVDTLQWAGSRYLPCWSPDGKQIAYYYTDDSLVSQSKIPVWDLCVQDAEGGDQRVLRRDVREIGRPAWSPDGTRLAFYSNRGVGIQVWTINVDGTGLQCLTQHVGATGHCSWSPDGRMIAYDFSDAINWEVYVMGTDGSNPTNLTRFWSDDWAPIWFRKQWEW